MAQLDIESTFAEVFRDALRNLGYKDFFVEIIGLPFINSLNKIK